MTNIIWLMYLADLVSSLSVCLTLGCFVALVYAGIARFATAIEERPCPPSVRPALIVAAILAATASAIPSKTTIYAIAATQAGERALQTETGDKAVRALNAWLDRQIAGGDEKK